DPPLVDGREDTSTVCREPTDEPSRAASGERRVRAGRGAHATLASFPFGSAPALPSAGRFPLEGVPWRMRRYELMLVLRPDVADDKAQAVIDRTTRGIVAGGGQIVKVAPWGRRRLAYQIDRYREGSYHIVLFEAPPDALGEMERTLQITEEVLRHLVTRDERPARPGRPGGIEDGSEGADDADLPSAEDEEDDDVSGRIDE